jgi:hypothetical protein
MRAYADSDALTYRLKVNGEFAAFEDLLAYPPYLALTLQNVELAPAQAGRPSIIDERTVRFKVLSLRFLKRKQQIFFYEAQVHWQILGKEAVFTIPVSVDASAMRKGEVLVAISLPYTRLLPQTIPALINSTLNGLRSDPIQQKLLSYFKTLEKRKKPGSDVTGINELILQEAYNKVAATAPVGGGAREPGDEEPFSDQVLFLGTVAIWFVLVPLAALSAFLLYRLRRRRLKLSENKGRQGRMRETPETPDGVA